MRLRHSVTLPCLLLVSSGFAAETSAPIPALALTVEPAPPVVQASIPFANMHGSIRDWRADDDKGIWIQGMGGKWYYATFFSPCHSIQFEHAVGFMPGSTGTLDRWGALYTRGTGKCRFSSLVTSTKPPAKSRKKADPSLKPGPAA
jgi:hypothetical protein